MKIIQIIGGLGNQLFQYAYGLAYQLRNQEQVKYDISWYSNQDRSFGGLVKNRQLMLYNYNIDLPVVNNTELKEFKSINKIPYRVIEEGLEFNSEYLRIDGNKYIQGFFQNENYFKEYKSEVCHALKVNTIPSLLNTQMLETIDNCNSVALHIRRGDYLQLSKVYASCTIEYYTKAINYIDERVENARYFVFSDDIAWALEMFGNNDKFTVVNINDDETAHFDIMLMSYCKHNIIANSTFSWWGAWLNRNKEKIVIAPSKWFNNNDTNIASKDWIKIENE